MRVVIIFLLAWLSIGSVHAEERIVRLNGGSISWKYSDLTPNSTLTIYGVSRGNSTNPVHVSLYGSKSIQLTAHGAKVTGSVSETLQTARLFFPLDVTPQKKVAATQKTCVDFSPGDAFSEDEPPFDPDSIVSTSDPLCDLYSAEDLQDLGEALSATYGGSWDAGRVCGYIVFVHRGPAPVLTPTPTPSGAIGAASTTREFHVLFHKNACGGTNDRYIFRLRLKLPGQLPPTGYLRVRVQETKHFGGKEATIKPLSEGRFAPSPLLLMNYLGFCGQKINVVRWNNDRPSRKTPAKVFDLVQYRGLVLTRTPFSRYLVGGRASIELYDANSGYGACFQLKRARQRVNGYPG